MMRWPFYFFDVFRAVYGLRQGWFMKTAVLWSAVARFERAATNNSDCRAKRRHRFGWQCLRAYSNPRAAQAPVCKTPAK
jgi:hypothetical protein